MSNLRVKINTAKRDEIAILYDIGPHRAERIVNYREVYGPFRGPEDLAKVEDITLNLAATLAPHIDWEMPLEPEQPKKRDWVGTFFWFTIFLTVALTVLMIGLSLLPLAVRANILTGSGTWFKILMTALGAAILVCFTIFAATRAGVALTTDKKQARKLSRSGLLSMGGALILSVILLLGMIIYFQFYSLNAWNTLKATPDKWLLVVGPVSFIFLFFFMVPQLIVWRRPDLISNPWLSRIFDAAIGLFGLVLVFGILVHPEFMPLWLLVLSSLAGVMIVAIAAVSIRRGESFFHASLDFIDLRAFVRQKQTTDDWRIWLNARLPDPVQQRELKDALEDIYHPSPTETFLRVLILGIGGWVVLTAVEAIIELYVQDWWKSLFE